MCLCQSDSPHQNFNPANLNEAVGLLKEIVSDSSKEKFMLMTEDEFNRHALNGLDRWVRNNLGLWQESDIVKYFKSEGIDHPDDMSGIILTSFYREIHNKPWDVMGQINFYQEWWRKSELHYRRLETDLFYVDSLKKAQIERFKTYWKPGMKVDGSLTQCGGDPKKLFYGVINRFKGTILHWQNDELAVLMTSYNKNDTLITECDGFKNDTILISDFSLIRLLKD